MQETALRIAGDDAGSNLCGYLNRAFLAAMALETRLPAWILEMEGMSGRTYRRLINNLVGSVPDARYLEIGSWAGSTACSAMYGNRTLVTCIDNWSEFGGPKKAFVRNVAAARPDGAGFRLIEQDFRKVDYGAIGRHDIYMFDGPHGSEDQYDGIVMVQEALADEFVLIVDDWNFPTVAPATRTAIEAAGLRLLFSIEITTTQDGGYPKQSGANSAWHNGYFLAVLRKPPQS